MRSKLNQLICGKYFHKNVFMEDMRKICRVTANLDPVSLFLGNRDINDGSGSNMTSSQLLHGETFSCPGSRLTSKLAHRFHTHCVTHLPHYVTGSQGEKPGWLSFPFKE